MVQQSFTLEHTLEAEMKEVKARVEDALNSVRAALPKAAPEDASEKEQRKYAGGILPGGGTALLRSVVTLDELLANSDLDMDILTGVKIVREAIQEPIRAIAKNAGVDLLLYSTAFEQMKKSTLDTTPPQTSMVICSKWVLSIQQKSL